MAEKVTKNEIPLSRKWHASTWLVESEDSFLHLVGTLIHQILVDKYPHPPNPTLKQGVSLTNITRDSVRRILAWWNLKMISYTQLVP